MVDPRAETAHDKPRELLCLALIKQVGEHLRHVRVLGGQDVDAVESFGSTLHLSEVDLGHFVRDVDGPGGQARVAEFLHEADLTHDCVLIQGDPELTSWSVSVAKQSDRYILLTSASKKGGKSAPTSAS